MTESKKFLELEKRLTAMSSPGIHPGLDRLREFIRLADNPQNKFPAVHVVGTNGKGSTAASIYSIFSKAGYKAALYTSPHLVSFSERLKIGSFEVSCDKWSEYTDKAEAIINSSKYLSEDRLTYFELITAVAFMIIADAGVDIAVIEAGLGGRLDASNILERVELTLITPIGIDHTEFLGSTLSEVAGEKFAVMRKNVPAVFAGGEPETEKLFRSFAKKNGAVGYLLSDLCEYGVTGLSLCGTEFYCKVNNVKTDYHFPLIGDYQAGNASLALVGASLLSAKYNKLDATALYNGIASAVWPGRFEVLMENPPLILDGAHNPHAMRALVDTVLHIGYNKDLKIVMAMMKDKDIDLTLSILKEINPKVVCTEIPNMERSMKASSLADKVKKAGISVISEYECPLDAVAESIQSGVPLISCGSLFLVGYLKEHLSIQQLKNKY